MFLKKEYQEEAFKGVDFQKEAVSAIEFHDCKFIRCNFSETLFKGCVFKSCQFEDCDLSLIKVDGSIFQGVKFKNTRAIGINWAKASWGGKDFYQLLKSIDFVECTLNYANFFGLKLAGIHIEKCVAHEADFSEADLKNANLKGTDFERSLFRKTNLERANFVGAKNYYLSPTLNNLKKAKFSMPEAMSLLYSMDIELVDYPEDD